MQQIKCFGKKQTKLIDTSKTKKFFDEFFVDDHKCGFKKKPVNDEEDSDDPTETQEVPEFFNESLFESNPIEPLDEICLKPKPKKCKGKKKQKGSIKISISKKYKGKKQKYTAKSSVLQQKSIAARGEPDFSSICEHVLKIENVANEHVDSPLNLNRGVSSSRKTFRSSLICAPSFCRSSLKLKSLRVMLDKLEIDPQNANKVFNTANFLKTPKARLQSRSSKRHILNTSLENVPAKVKNLHVSKKLEIDSKNVDTISNPATPISLESFNDKDNFFSQNYITYTSTPAISSDKPRCVYINTPNLSAISLHLPHESHLNSQLSNLQSHISINQVAGYDSAHSILLKLLEVCNQNEVLEFDKVYDLRKTFFRKIGEGSYAEVFTLTQNKKSFIIKIIPVSEDFSGPWQSMASVYSEIKVSQCLSKLRNNENNQTMNFNSLKGAHMVKGCYPQKLLDAWDFFSIKQTTENLRPDMFEKDQMYVIIESEYGGQDISLPLFGPRSAWEAESIFQQIAISLAIAEEENLFEHRDLHLGNILVQRIENKSLSYVLRGIPFSIASRGLMVTIIDFTFARIFDSGIVYYNDLAHEKSLFEQSGDIQYDVYKAIKFELKSNFQESLLYTNVLWLTYLCRKFLEYCYTRTNSKRHKISICSFKALLCKMEECKSALDCLEACNIMEIPKSKEDQVSMQSKDAVFIDRKSLQK